MIKKSLELFGNLKFNIFKLKGRNINNHQPIKKL